MLRTWRATNITTGKTQTQQTGWRIRSSPAHPCLLRGGWFWLLLLDRWPFIILRERSRVQGCGHLDAQPWQPMEHAFLQQEHKLLAFCPFLMHTVIVIHSSEFTNFQLCSFPQVLSLPYRRLHNWNPSVSRRISKNPNPPIFLSHSAVGSAVKMLWEKLNIFFFVSHTPFPPHTQAPLLPLAHLLLFVSHFTAPGSSQCLPLSPGGFKDLPLTLPEELQFGQFAPVSSSHRWEETGHLSVHFAVTENKEFLTFPSQNAAGSHLSSNFLGSFAQLGQ